MDDILSEKGVNGFIGAAFTENGTNILIGEENIFNFLGQNAPVDIAEYIHESCKEGFLTFVSGADYTPRFITAKCRRADGEYRDISFAVRKIRLKDTEYTHIELYDIGIMTKEYEKYAFHEKLTRKYMDISGDIFFRYDIKSGKIVLYREGDVIFDGDFSSWRDDVVANGYIAGGCIEFFYGICEAIKEANVGLYYALDTAFFTKNGEFARTSVFFYIGESNSTPMYTMGRISASELSKHEQYDALTGVFNKRGIKEAALACIEDAARRKTSVVLVIIDLDHFKSVNDLYGHIAGDKALQNAARIIKGYIGNRGMLGRIGGDEFFAVIPDYSGEIEELRAILRAIRVHIQWHFAHCREDVKVTSSIGSVCYPNDADNYDDLFKIADFCLYRAKAKGRNRFITFNTEVHGSAEKILSESNNTRLSGFVSDDDKTAHILSVIGRSRQVTDPKQFINDVTAEMKHFYAIDTIQFCPAVPGKEYFESSNRTITEPMAVLEMYDTYRSQIAERGYLMLGHYMNARGFLPDLSNFMEKNNMFSILVDPFFGNDNELMGIFVLTSDIQYNWTGIDITNMQILCRIMERFI